ncbi:hypothetical protein [Sinisalibacter aestuarii]|uniref:Flagellar FliJ protein n=1 Tax=Sinisalibacter aestuarii TaxID=2949426 RepID=A0ABQ5LNV9_9RHOB|nr:hypothetical protein [Sinisalibacter aestuarii]GKY86684.1 hypothetical protein STA1M1_05530 [Sinisalibacter aestuarii]
MSAAPGKDLAALEALAGMVFEAELARLDALSRALADRKADLAALDGARRKRAEALAGDCGADDLAFITGQDARWSGWLGRERARISREVAEIAARREAQRLRAQTAFGKRDALRMIREREAARARQVAARVAE